MKMDLIFDKIESALDAFEKWWQKQNACSILLPVLLGTWDGVYFDYNYIEELFLPLNKIWKNHVLDVVHVDSDWVCYRFRVFEPISLTDRYRLTKRAEQASKLVLTSWMREHGYYYEVDSLVACYLEMDHLDVYMARTTNGVQMLDTIRKRTQAWKS
ncbi:MAG: hypothetical protein PUA59_06285 [Clostridium sp.]|nr:hypothetical protein [Clostridium sp.]